MKNSEGEEYTKTVHTSWGWNLAATESEFMFYETLIILANRGLISQDTMRVSESHMILRGYVPIDYETQKEKS